MQVLLCLYEQLTLEFSETIVLGHIQTKLFSRANSLHPPYFQGLGIHFKFCSTHPSFVVQPCLVLIRGK